MLIREYQESWAKDFNRIKMILQEKDSLCDLRIEHIGSTAVEKLASKPIIDIDIVYKNIYAFDKVKSDLEDLGYFHNGNQGIEGREVFKRVQGKEFHKVLDVIDHHLYVCHVNNEEFRRHLSLRDFLRENEKERIEYERLKCEIATRANQDRKEYAKLKEVVARDFIEAILSKAEVNQS